MKPAQRGKHHAGQHGFRAAIERNAVDQAEGA